MGLSFNKRKRKTSRQKWGRQEIWRANTYQSGPLLQRLFPVIQAQSLISKFCAKWLTIKCTAATKAANVRAAREDEARHAGRLVRLLCSRSNAMSQANDTCHTNISPSIGKDRLRQQKRYGNSSSRRSCIVLSSSLFARRNADGAVKLCSQKKSNISFRHRRLRLVVVVDALAQSVLITNTFHW